MRGYWHDHKYEVGKRMKDVDNQTHNASSNKRTRLLGWAAVRFES